MSSKHNRILFMILALALVSLACSLFSGGQATPKEPGDAVAGPNETLLGEQQQNLEGGFAFRSIPGYGVESYAGVVNMLEAGADSNIGPVIVLMGGAVAEGSNLDELIAFFTSEDEDVRIVDEADTSVNGLPAKAFNLAGNFEGTPIAGRMVALMVDSDQQFMIIGGSPPERWEKDVRPLFDAVLASVTFFEPQPMEWLPTTEPEPVETEDVAPPATPEPVARGGELRQWAVSATASTEFGSVSWSANSATGEPDVFTCEDAIGAWASLGMNTVDWLELRYSTPVQPTEVNIRQTYNPTQVIKVELVDEQGGLHEVYSATPELLEECPFTLSIPISAADYQAVGVKITVDQSVIENTSWNEIDAVELVGIAGEGAASGGQGAGQTSNGPAPEGFLWRIGGPSTFDEGDFAILGDMDTDDQGRLYVADGIHGIFIFDPQGELVKQFNHDDMRNAVDLKVGPDGNIYVAAWGSNSIFVFSPEGDLITRFGEEGTGEGQFGTFSPDDLAIAPNGNVYAMDENENEAGDTIVRVHIFSPQGDWIDTFPIEEAYFSPGGMDFGPDGNLYVVGFIGSYILKISPQGEVLGKLGQDALEPTGPQGLAIDQQGNFYVAVWLRSGVLKLDPQGNLVGEFGFGVEDGDQAWGEGGFYQLSGVAVSPDGSQVYASDWSSNFAYITSFQIK